MPVTKTSPGSGSNAAVPTTLEEQDHRVRTGAARREQTRRKLLAAALRVFAEKGVDAPQIEDFIAAAGVARGTFYNYFSTTQELLDAVTSDLSDVVLAEIDKVVLPIQDPLQRLATGCLLYMHLGVDIPSWGAFVTRTGFRSEAVGKLVDIYLPRDLELARKAGHLDYPSLRAARDLIFSSINQAMLTVVSSQANRDHLRLVLALGLRGLGAAPDLATRLSLSPLPEIHMPSLQVSSA